MKKWENEQNRKFSNKYKWQKITWTNRQHPCKKIEATVRFYLIPILMAHRSPMEWGTVWSVSEQRSYLDHIVAVEAGICGGYGSHSYGHRKPYL
jgi:hypothetical protein